jgi:hypothetical protein
MPSSFPTRKIFAATALRTTWLLIALCLFASIDWYRLCSSQRCYYTEYIGRSIDWQAKHSYLILQHDKHIFRGTERNSFTSESVGFDSILSFQKPNNWHILVMIPVCDHRVMMFPA